MTRWMCSAMPVLVLLALALPFSCPAAASDSELEWAKALNATNIHGIHADAEDNVYVLCYALNADILLPTPAIPLNRVTVLAKFSPSGELLWSKTLPFLDRFAPTAFAPPLDFYLDAEGNAVVCGEPTAPLGPPETRVYNLWSPGVLAAVKLDPNGNILWYTGGIGPNTAFGAGILATAGVTVVDRTWPRRRRAIRRLGIGVRRGRLAQVDQAHRRRPQ